jgi:threonine/homoserine/homoserine lactone efflux protein
MVEGAASHPHQRWALAVTESNPLWLYFLLVAGIVALPGMDMALVTGSALAHGRRAGFAALGGIVAGGLVHVGLGVAGLGLLLQGWPALFNGLLVAGAAYVAWLAWGLWRAPALATPDAATAPGRPARQAFASGALTCLLNPKAYLFGVAVFPQFLPPPGASATDWWARALGLAAITAGTQLAVYGGLALLAGRPRSAPRPHLQRGVALLLAGTAALTLAQAWRP